MSKTHFVVGLATSLAVIQPKSFNECMVAVIGGGVGGVLADNDILDNDYLADALIGQLLALGTAAIAIVLDFYLDFGICQAIINKPFLPIIGGISFTILYIIGFCSDHRTFTHSFLALILYTFTSMLIHVPLAIPLATAYLSHLLLDILNKKKIPLLYPLDFGICLKMCYANKTANKVFMYVGSAVSGFLLLIGIILSFTNT